MKIHLTILLSIWAAIVTAGTKYYEHGDTIMLPCDKASVSIYFKVMRQFALDLVSPMLRVNSTLSLKAANNQQCAMRSNLTICTFNGMTTKVDVTCPHKLNLVFQVVNPAILTESAKATYVEIANSEFTRGVVSLLIEGEVADAVRSSKNSQEAADRILSFSNCVEFVSLFESYIKIAMQTKYNTSCIIGLRNGIEGSWFLSTAISQVTDIGQQIHDESNKFTIRTYKIPQRDNYTLETLVQGDQGIGDGQLYVSLGFRDVTGSVSYYIVSNFERGVTPFRSQVFHNGSALTLTIMSNFDIFYQISFNQSTQDQIYIEDEEYLFTKFTDQTQFIVELDDFNKQNEVHRTVKLYHSIEAANTIKFEYAQCSTNNTCQIPTPISAKMQNEFEPKCENLVDGSLCYIKIFTRSIKGPTVFGVLVHLPMQYVDLDLDEIHRGTLENGALAKFIISAQKLSKVKDDQIFVFALGVKAYLTYEPNCRRISCAEYHVRESVKAIPNLRKDLLVLLEGTFEVIYNLQISAQRNSKFNLQDGLVHYASMYNQSDMDYYTFQIPSKEIALEIKCNAPANTLQLLLNTKGNQFPTSSNFTHNSSNGYIYLPPNQMKEMKINKLHIGIHRRPKKSNGSIYYGILVVSEGNEIKFKYNVPYYDHFQSKAVKTYVFDVQKSTLPQTGIAFKLDILNSEFDDTHLQVKIGLKQQFEYTGKDIQTFNIDKEKLSTLCPVVQEKDICKVPIEITNKQAFPADVELLFWLRKEPLKLVEGEFSSFDSGSIGNEAYFYIQITNNNPINVYAYSTELNIQFKTQMINIEHNTSSNKWPFPHIPKTEEEMLNDPPTFTKYKYFSEQVLKTLLSGEDPSQIEQNKKKQMKKDEKNNQTKPASASKPEAKKKSQNASSYILITVKDYENRQNQSNTTTQRLNKGKVELIYFTDKVTLEYNNKVQYFLKTHQSIQLSYQTDIQDKTQQQIYLHNSVMNGEATTSVKYYSEQNGQIITQIIKADAQDIIVVDVAKFIKKFSIKGDDFNLKFNVTCQSGSAHFLSIISSTDTEIRQLTLGTPEQFYIKKNSSVVLEFMDYYNQDFTIKINRERGFPHYKIVSCKANVSQFDCLKELEEGSRDVQDPGQIITGGRPHQLFINRRSQLYCKQCRYYIGFYSYDEQIVGSVTIIRDNVPVLLFAGQSITSQVYPNDTDSYSVLLIPEREAKIIVSPRYGKLKVKTFTLGNQKTEKQYTIERDAQQIIFESLKTQMENKIIEVYSEGSQNAMYSLLFMDADSSITLKDGMSMTLTKPVGTTTLFNYECNTNSTLVILANISLQVQVNCLEQVYELLTPEEKKALPAQWRRTTNQAKLKPTFSLMTNTSTVNLNAEFCKKYAIEIINKDEAQYTISIIGQDYAQLSLGMALPGSIPARSNRVYTLSINEKLQLKIVLKQCQQSDLSIGLAYDMKDLTNKDFDQSFDVTSEQSFQVFKHKAHPGILYISISTLSQPAQFTIQVFPFHPRPDYLETRVHLYNKQISAEITSLLQVTDNSTTLDKAKNMVSKIQGTTFYYSLIFAPISIDSMDIQHKVDYFIIQSESRLMLEKVSKCQGAFMNSQATEHMTVSEQKLNVSATNKVVMTRLSKQKGENQSSTVENNLYLKAKYQSQYPYSFITIIPIIKPALPSHVSYEHYEITELTGGSGSLWFVIKRTAHNMYNYIQKKTSIENNFILGFLTAMLFGFIGSSIFVLSFVLIQCLKISLQTSAGFYRRTPVATSELDSHMNRQPQNQLGMLESSETHISAQTTENAPENIAQPSPPETSQILIKPTQQTNVEIKPEESLG